ncbi:hypothetical protein OOZ19_03420 [Saccharopolyspora sp. NFXS83]|uniref:hypothetical protein n=1 Tax=Saccharopolyspora sp. NFXS83 TaxID=2993560 RepID=UPI00224A8C7C|nr:hypothetical protein [Saccharopolyspora sp. NFXS83]MCX2729277.1 hypothetical protein [Saccharopolyspora sp. NFXS83]
MRIDVNMYVVAVEPDAARAAELARSMANWVGGDCRIIRAADAAEARTILNRMPSTATTRVLLAAEDLGGGASGIDFLKQIKTEPVGTGLRLRGLLTAKPQEAGDDGIVRFVPEPDGEALMYHFVHLLRSGGTDVAAVQVEGPPHAARMQRVKRSCS